MTPTVDGEPVGWIALPAEALCPTPLADTRAPRSAVTLLGADGGLGVDAVIATEFPLVLYRAPWGSVSAGLEAGAFLRFGAGGELTFDLYTFDGLFGIPLAWAKGPWSARVAWTHLSAHYGDGVRTSGDRPTNLEAWSREQVQVQVVRTAGPARFYGGGRVLLHSLPEASPFAVQVGSEGVGPWRVSPYGAVDLQLAAETAWVPAVSGQLGGIWQAEYAALRVSAVGRIGPEDTGKMTGEIERYVGLLVGFDRSSRASW